MFTSCSSTAHRSGKHDPLGLHGAIWSFFDAEEETLPEGPVCLASYLASRIPEATWSTCNSRDPLTEMPLFLEDRAHMRAPLENTYMAAYRGMPHYYREILEATESEPVDGPGNDVEQFSNTG